MPLKAGRGLGAVRVGIAATLLAFAAAPAGAALPPSALLADPAVEAYRAGRYQDAVDGLRRLTERHPDDILALRYLGLSYYGLERYTEAARVLEQAAEREPGNATTWLYLGLARYALGQYAAATDAFDRAERIDPDARTAEVSQRYRSAIRQFLAQRTVPPPPTARRWSLTVSGGIAYDDNVPLTARGTPGPKESWRTFQSAWGGYDLVQGGGWRLRAEGFAYLGQNLRSSLDEFDQMTFEAALDLSYQTRLFGIPVRPGLRYAFQPAWEGGSEYFQSHAVTASLVAQPTDDTISYLYYRFAHEDYRNDGTQPRLTSQDGGGHSVGLTQYLYSDDRRHYVYAGYAYQWLNADGSFYDYNGHRFAVGGAISLPWDLRLALRAEWLLRDYDRYPISPARTLDRQTYSAVLTKPILDGLSVSAGYRFIDEDSNYPTLAYRQNLFTLSLNYDF